MEQWSVETLIGETSDPDLSQTTLALDHEESQESQTLAPETQEPEESQTVAPVTQEHESLEEERAWDAMSERLLDKQPLGQREVQLRALSLLHCDQVPIWTKIEKQTEEEIKPELEKEPEMSEKQCEQLRALDPPPSKKNNK